MLCTRRFEQKGFKLVALKMMQADEALLKEHYKDLVKKPFFPSLLSYMTSGPVVPMVWEGDGVVAAGRVILGATKPSESAPGTVRGDYAIDVGRNVCHGISSFSCCLWYLFCFMVCATASVPPLLPASVPASASDSIRCLRGACHSVHARAGYVHDVRGVCAHPAQPSGEHAHIQVLYTRRVELCSQGRML